MEPQVETHSPLIFVEGAREDSAQRSKVRGFGLHGIHPPLVGALVVGEEKGAVFADRPSQEVAVLPALEERIGIAKIATQTGICRDIVIAIKGEDAPVKLIATGARDDVDGA